MTKHDGVEDPLDFDSDTAKDIRKKLGFPEEGELSEEQKTILSAALRSEERITQAFVKYFDKGNLEDTSKDKIFELIDSEENLSETEKSRLKSELDFFLDLFKLRDLAEEGI